jgi:hydroxyacylglutathione hydrolase
VKLYSLFSSIGFSNSYLIGPDGGGPAVLVDPGNFDIPLLQAVEGNGLTVRWILVTHAHSAHFSGVRSLLKVYDAGIYTNQPSALDFPAHHVQDGDALDCGSFSVTVLETPGHSIDSVCFLLDRFLFTGDTLNAGGIGRTRDGYARGLLLSSVRKRILPLGNDTLVFPGHGPPTKLGVEKAYNPYLDEKL